MELLLVILSSIVIGITGAYIAACLVTDAICDIITNDRKGRK